jgi:hypothetical protein
VLFSCHMYENINVVIVRSTEAEILPLQFVFDNNGYIGRPVL